MLNTVVSRYPPAPQHSFAFAPSLQCTQNLSPLFMLLSKISTLRRYTQRVPVALQVSALSEAEKPRKCIDLQSPKWGDSSEFLEYENLVFEQSEQLGRHVCLCNSRQSACNQKSSRKSQDVASENQLSKVKGCADRREGNNMKGC